jgi:hypothetical protein
MSVVIRLSQITIGQMGPADAALIEEYKKMLNLGSVVPPIKVARIPDRPGTFIVIDGNHVRSCRGG